MSIALPLRIPWPCFHHLWGQRSYRSCTIAPWPFTPKAHPSLLFDQDELWGIRPCLLAHFCSRVNFQGLVDSSSAVPKLNPVLLALTFAAIARSRPAIHFHTSKRWSQSVNLELAAVKQEQSKCYSNYPWEDSRLKSWYTETQCETAESQIVIQSRYRQTYWADRNRSPHLLRSDHAVVEEYKPLLHLQWLSSDQANLRTEGEQVIDPVQNCTIHAHQIGHYLCWRYTRYCVSRHRAEDVQVLYRHLAGGSRWRMTLWPESGESGGGGRELRGSNWAGRDGRRVMPLFGLLACLGAISPTILDHLTVVDLATGGSQGWDGADRLHCSSMRVLLRRETSRGTRLSRLQGQRYQECMKLRNWERRARRRESGGHWASRSQGDLPKISKVSGASKATFATSRCACQGAIWVISIPARRFVEGILDIFHEPKHIGSRTQDFRKIIVLRFLASQVKPAEANQPWILLCW